MGKGLGPRICGSPVKVKSLVSSRRHVLDVFYTNSDVYEWKPLVEFSLNRDTFPDLRCKKMATSASSCVTWGTFSTPYRDALRYSRMNVYLMRLCAAILARSTR